MSGFCVGGGIRQIMMYFGTGNISTSVWPWFGAKTGQTEFDVLLEVNSIKICLPIGGRHILMYFGTGKQSKSAWPSLGGGGQTTADVFWV